MYGKWQRVCHSSRATLGAVLTGWGVSVGFVPGALGQELETNRLARLITPVLLSYETTSKPSMEAEIETNAVIAVPSWSEIVKPTRATAGDRLVRFEEEYGTDQESRSPFERVLRAAKYGLDKACFTAQEAARKLEFKYDTAYATSGVLGGDAGNPQYYLPVFGRFSHAQLQTVVTVHDPQTGQAFFGATLSVPFGPGGEDGVEAAGSRPHLRSPAS